MEYQQREILAAKRREFSRKSMMFGGAFILTAIAALFVDLTGVLEYFKVFAGSASTTLETGAIISGVTAVPFLAMGMSISADSYRRARESRQAAERN